MTRAMPKTRTVVLIFVGALLHFVAMAKVIIDRLTCDEVPHCVSALNNVAGIVLSFPLGWITATLSHFWPSVNFLAVLGPTFFYVFLIFNSLLAVTLFWLVLIKSPMRRREARRTI